MTIILLQSEYQHLNSSPLSSFNFEENSYLYLIKADFLSKLKRVRMNPHI